MVVAAAPTASYVMHVVASALSNFTTCLSFNKNLDFPEATTRGERRDVNLCRQYIKENPTIKTLKRVKITVKRAPDAATPGSAPVAAPAAAVSAGKDKVITPVIDIRD
jgi:hypothetical protein|eukprot:4513422-Prymnesium_polylepis.1